MISRRKLAVGSLAGALFGLSGVALLRNDASIRFMGQGNTIIALLDTSRERVLFVLGEQNEGLLEKLNGLTTAGNSRIDLVVATHRILTTQAGRKHLRPDLPPTLAMQTSSSLPPLRGQVTTALDSTTVEIGEETMIEVEVAGSDPDHPDFLVTILCQGADIVFTNSKSGLRLMKDPTCDLLALPGSADAITGSYISPKLLVTNAPMPELDGDQLEVFPSDPSVVRIGNGGISVRDDQLSS